MSVAKVIEISAESNESIEAAIRTGIERAGQTVQGIQGAWIKEQQVLVQDGKVTGFRVHLNVTFKLV
jgi:hypothetical protein